VDLLRGGGQDGSEGNGQNGRGQHGFSSENISLYAGTIKPFSG
jgi:hypothetical protein